MTIQFAYAARAAMTGTAHQPMWMQFDDEDGAAPAGHHVTATRPEGLWLDADGVTLRAPTADDLREEARTDKLADLKRLRDAIQYDAFLYEGHWIDCDKTARANLTGLQLSVVSGADPFPYQWRTADNVWLALPDRTTWASLMECFEMHAKKTWAAYAVHEAAIVSSADPASHGIAAGEWPDTRIDKGAF